MNDKVFEAMKHINIRCHPQSRGNDPIDEDIKLIKQELTDKQDLEKFTRLVIDKRVAMDLITNEEVKDFIKYNSHCDKYDFIVPLTEEEFTFIREMIKKYE